MVPFALNGRLWRVVRVLPGDPYLMGKLGVADFENRMIGLSWDLTPPLLDKVLLHEIGHAVTMENGYKVDEESAQLIENHALEAVKIASDVLGRPVCISGTCL